MDFSLFFFSADGSTGSRDKYDLLLECAKLADRRGFEAIWTPERHFQDFGGLYPNPSVLSAALAMVTESVAIRGGSVVVPLHHPIRVVEEWSLVDNLSGGRVGVALASGWHPHDFVLSTVSQEERKTHLFRHIQTLRDLWAGKAVRFHDRDGRDYDLRVLPRPIQEHLPIWISTAGSPDTWNQAAVADANVLTGLGYLSLDELSANIRSYRRALSAHGHDPKARRVTVMVHTHLGETDEQVKELVRDPMHRYLSGFLGQTKGVAGTARSFDAVSEADERDLLEVAFDRYFERTSLFGTQEKCAGLIETLIDIGVDEVACLVDFGLDKAATLSGVERLDELRDRYDV